MNSTFKVVFNKARGALMVVNEATSSVQAKGTKTVIAAAVTALMAGGAVAALPEGGVIDNSHFPTNLVTGTDTNKLISGQGDHIIIQTNGSMDAFATKVSEALKQSSNTKKLLGLIGALGVDGQNSVIAGVTGGHNLMDHETATDLYGMMVLGLLVATGDQEYAYNFSKKFLGQFNYKYEDSEASGGYFEDPKNLVFVQDKDTHITVGDSEGKSNPLVVGVVGGDTFLSINNANATITNKGTATLDFKSGNTAGVVAGSFIVNTAYGNKNDYGTASASVGKTVINITDTANVGLFTGGGVAIGLAGANASSTVTQGTKINIDIKDGDDPLDGLVIGGLGGGLAVATGNDTVQGNAEVDAGTKTTITVNNGNVFGLLGGGAAISFDVNLMKSGKGLGDYAFSLIQGLIGSGSGIANSNSGAIEIALGEKSDTAAIVGGGVAIADASSTHSASSTATAQSVTMNFAGHDLTAAEKSQVHAAGGAFVQKLMSWKDGGLQNISFTDVKGALADLSEGINVDGVHLGNLGGGISFARGTYESANSGSAVATSKVGSVMMNFTGGYNVATAGGGLALALDKTGTASTNETAEGESLQISSVSDVGTVALNISGGENILVTAGGLSYATAENGQKSQVKAESTVGNASVNVTGGSVDGLFGGGIAIDDTNQDTENAVTKTTSVVITLDKGTINKANVDPILSLGNNGATSTPGNRDYLYQTAHVVGKDAQAAIVGGGFATGGGALAEVGNVNIELDNGTVNGNVFAGGVATLQGKSTVGEALVRVDGATVNGDIYGGGIAGDSGNQIANYKGGTATVGETTIQLRNGELDGNVYAGGKAFEEGSDVSVKTALVEIGTDFKFLKDDAVIDGSGADNATLNFINGYDFSKAETSEVALLADNRIVITGFDKLESGDLVTGADYDMGGKTNVVVTGNYEFGQILNVADTQTMSVEEGGALAVQSTVAPANKFVVKEGVLALGTTAKTADARESLGKYNETAGLYLSGQADLSSATINIGNAEATTGVNLGSNGSLVVDATAATEDAPATTVTGTINAAEGSTLHYVNVADQGIVTIDVDGKVKTTVDNLLFKVVEVENGVNQFTFERATGSDLAGTGLEGFDGDALVGMADNEVIGSLLDQGNTAITSGSQREARISGALNLAAAGGVQTAGIQAATLGIDQATKRAALTNVFTDGWTGFAEVTGSALKMGGDSGALETKTELGGITVGGEYTMGDMTFGVMGNFGTGDVEGEGDNKGAENDVDYYGIQGYAAKRIGQFNLVGQMGFMMTKNDVTSADGDSADIDATVFTIGARGEMAFELSKSCQAVPYIGLNYLRVTTDGYNTAKGFSVGDIDQNLVNMPIGVAFSGNMDLASGWTLRPTVDVAYVHTFGDTDADVTTRFGDAAINTDLDVWSENVGRVGFGLEARKDALAIGGQIGGAFGDNDHREFYGQINVKYLF